MHFIYCKQFLIGFKEDIVFKLIRWFEKKFKTNYMTLRTCNDFNCKYNHAEICFLREDVDRLLYCVKMQDTMPKKEIGHE